MKLIIAIVNHDDANAVTRALTSGGIFLHQAVHHRRLSDGRQRHYPDRRG